MSIDFLNSIAQQSKAAESPDYKPHPLGEFHGVVQKVENKYVKQMNNSVMELKIATTDQNGNRVGVANYNEWMFNSEDIQNAQSSEEGREKLKSRIARMKRLFVDLDVYTPDYVDTMPWSNPHDPNNPGMLESFDKLMDARCSVTVKANTRPNKPAMVFVNAPLDIVTGVSGPAPEIAKKSAPMGMGTPPSYPMAQQGYGGQPMGMGHPQPMSPPASNLNNIPF